MLPRKRGTSAPRGAQRRIAKQQAEGSVIRAEQTPGCRFLLKAAVADALHNGETGQSGRSEQELAVKRRVFADESIHRSIGQRRRSWKFAGWPIPAVEEMSLVRQPSEP